VLAIFFAVKLVDESFFPITTDLESNPDRFSLLSTHKELLRRNVPFILPLIDAIFNLLLFNQYDRKEN
jgi:hypothetical protein